MPKQRRIRKPLQLYVEDELRAKIEQAARIAGLTVSTYLAGVLRERFRDVPLGPDPLQRIADLERRLAALEAAVGTGVAAAERGAGSVGESAGAPVQDGPAPDAGAPEKARGRKTRARA